jgi:DNA repair protein RadD
VAFLFQTQLKRAASTEQIIKCDEPIVEILKVDHLTCALHQKAGKPDGMRVSYFCGMNKYSSYIMVEHTGFARRKAKEWWEKRTRLRFPETTAEALQTFDQLEVPTHIRVWLNKPYPEILNESFDGGFAMPVSSIDPPF